MMALVNGFVIHLVIHFVWARTVTSRFLPNINCNTRLTVVPTTSDTSYRFYPYFVNLHRCQGSKGRKPPTLMECVPAQVETVNVEVRPLQTADKSNGFLSIQGKMYLPMVNHTSCKVQCAFKREDCRKPNVYDKAGCKCVCNLGLIGPAGMICRDSRKMWSNVYCGCMCKNTQPCRNRRQYFDQNSCSCKCKKRRLATKDCVFYGENYDPSTCSCFKKARRVKQNQDINQEQHKKSNIGLWITAAAIELFLMLCAFDVFLYKHEAGFSFKVKSKISSKDKPRISDSDDHEEKPHETTKFRVTFKEILRRQSRVSSSLRKRSSAYSSSCPGPQTPLITSPSQDNIAEDVFFQE